MADNGFITNRRHLLIAMSASAFIPYSTVRPEPPSSIALAAEDVEGRPYAPYDPDFDRACPEPVEGLSPNGFVEKDSALRAYCRIMEIEKALLDIPADEDDPRYLSWVRKLEQAENHFAQSRASCPEAIGAKLNRLAYHSAWEPEQAIRESLLARSIVLDFAALTTG